MGLGRYRVFNSRDKQHYTVTEIDFKNDKFTAILRNDMMIGHISEHSIERMISAKDKRGFDIYQGDVVRYQRDRILIEWDETEAAFVGRNLSRPNPYGKLGVMSTKSLGGKCELLGPEAKGA